MQNYFYENHAENTGKRAQDPGGKVQMGCGRSEPLKNSFPLNPHTTAGASWTGREKKGLQADLPPQQIPSHQV